MKRKFSEIRKKILLTLNKKEMARMQLAKSLNADYRTIDRHLIWLLGEERIKKVRNGEKILYSVL